MTIQIEFWQLLTFLVGLLLTFLSVAFAFGRILLSQVEKRLDQRFQVIEVAAKEEAKQWARVEREFLRFQADLPLQYVRRDDYVRGQSVIESKLDALYNKIEVVQLRGTQV